MTTESLIPWGVVLFWSGVIWAVANVAVAYFFLHDPNIISENRKAEMVAGLRAATNPCWVMAFGVALSPTPKEYRRSILVHVALISIGLLTAATPFIFHLPLSLDL